MMDMNTIIGIGDEALKPGMGGFVGGAYTLFSLKSPAGEAIFTTKLTEPPLPSFSSVKRDFLFLLVPCVHVAHCSCTYWIVILSFPPT